MSNFDDREPGYYWIRWLEPVCDGGGVVDEKWTEPEIALLNRRGRWMLVGSDVPLCLSVEILEPVPNPFVGVALPERGRERG